MGYYLTPNDFDRAAANGIHADLLKQRVMVYGWPVERAIKEPVRKQQDRSEWRAVADRNGIPSGTFYHRINRYGWPLERAATEPVMSRDEQLRLVRETRHRKYPPEWIDTAVQNGITPALFRERVRAYGWSYERAATEPRMSHSASGRLGKQVLLERSSTR